MHRHLERAEKLANYLDILGPYLDQLVIAGGWAPFVYACMHGSETGQDALLTKDLDAVLPRSGFVESGKPLEAVILDSGYERKFLSLDIPPAIKYAKDDGGEPYEIEFITDAPGEHQGSIGIGSVNASELHFVKILGDNKIGCPGELFGKGFFVPEPAAFILHKILVAPRRGKKEKAAKDFFYSYYVMDSLCNWREDTERSLARMPDRYAAWAKRARKCIGSWFEDENSIGVSYIESYRGNLCHPEMDKEEFRKHVAGTMRSIGSILEAGAAGEARISVPKTGAIPEISNPVMRDAREMDRRLGSELGGKAHGQNGNFGSRCIEGPENRDGGVGHEPHAR